jgi:hypothetical protein
MRSSFLKGVLLGSLVAAVVTMTGTAFAGSGIGAIFNLGKTNTVNRTTTLTGTTSGKLLQVTNKGAGAALGLNVKAGNAPLTVNSTGRVVNLNADTVDGMHASDLMQANGALFQSRRTITLPAAGPVEILAVPGFGSIRATFETDGGLASPTFVNTQGSGSVTVGFLYGSGGPYTRPEEVSPDASHTFNWVYDTAAAFELFLADTTRAASLRVWWWPTSADTVEVFAQGIAQ